MAGLRMDDVKSVAKAVLPRFYLEDIRESAYKIFSSSQGKKFVVSSIPRVMIEPFLREYLNSDFVIGTELKTVGGFCLGLVARPGLMVGVCQFEALRKILGDDKKIDIGLGNARNVDNSFMFLCQEGYIVPVEDNPSCLQRKDYPKPLIFHDGRLVAKPTRLDSLAILLWLPFGILLAISRAVLGTRLPYKYALMTVAATGLKIRVKLPSESHTCQTHLPYSRCTCESYGKHGLSCTLYACSHRSLMDPVVLSTALQRPVTAVTYSISRLSEIISPIKTVRFSRDRVKDGETMRELLRKSDLVVCPEGTTCREPYLLRFSPLFAEIADTIVPVAITAKGSMFHGTTVRGYKWLDSFFFLMNPSPYYHLEFLEKISGVRTCESQGRSSYEIANHVQKMIGQALGFECTNLTRRDKYRMLAGNDGVQSSG
ncbi:Phospholipid/glycerol acyltransferase [Macleaya cordata]|uniref:Phospholipid/glycerol acyltransferase n=1 Tax=Macleaya cordata TaxID=56857 RepID=A0A200Q0Y0_MACCD|nr:Phospholipid/glycerol acyltransferase [Macleaya cordata]